jgi:hypothetical protein
MSMDRGRGENALLGLFEPCLHSRIRKLALLEAQHGADKLQAILYTMMRLTHQEVFLSD